jgi:hypothetical protein
MRYISTRGAAPSLDFQGVTLAGLASDGGLYVPESWPRFSHDQIAALAGLTYVETAVRVCAPFVGDALTEDELRRILTTAYASFSHAAIAPLVQLDERHWLLELFHGPTLAFKDVAMQALGRLFETFLGRTGGHVTIIGATSGDTGSAAIDALAADITAFLEDRPVSARAASPGYVMWKWLGRHRSAAVAAALGALGPIKVFPSTIFIGRDGRVREVHVGWAGPATGALNAKAKRDFDATVTKLLREKA